MKNRLIAAAATILMGAVALVPNLDAAVRGAIEAKRFDLIYADKLKLTMCPLQCGGVSGAALCLLVNTGAFPITDADLAGMTFRVTSSNTAMTLAVQNALELNHPVGPVQRHEAIGSRVSAAILPGAWDNTILFPLLRPDESFRIHRHRRRARRHQRRGPSGHDALRTQSTDRVDDRALGPRGVGPAAPMPALTPRAAGSVSRRSHRRRSE